MNTDGYVPASDFYLADWGDAFSFRAGKLSSPITINNTERIALLEKKVAILMSYLDTSAIPQEVLKEIL